MIFRSLILFSFILLVVSNSHLYCQPNKRVVRDTIYVDSTQISIAKGLDCQIVAAIRFDSRSIIYVDARKLLRYLSRKSSFYKAIRNEYFVNSKIDRKQDTIEILLNNEYGITSQNIRRVDVCFYNEKDKITISNAIQYSTKSCSGIKDFEASVNRIKVFVEIKLNDGKDIIVFNCHTNKQVERIVKETFFYDIAAIGIHGTTYHFDNQFNNIVIDKGTYIGR